MITNIEINQTNPLPPENKSYDDKLKSKKKPKVIKWR